MSVTVSSTQASSRAIDLPLSCDVPWRPGMRLGSGINSVTGATAPAAFAPFVDDSESTESLQVEIRLAPDLHGAHDAAFSVRESPLLSLQPLSLRAWTMAKALSLAHPLRHTLSFVVWWTEVATSEVAPQKLQKLSLSTFAMMAYAGREDHMGFRERYGDYFVAGWATGKHFSAVLTFTYEDEAHYRSVLENLRSGGDAPFAHSLEVKTIDASFNTHGRPDRGSVRIFMRTGAGEVEEIRKMDLASPVPPEVFASCYDRLHDFAADHAGDKVSARLQHYSLYFQEPTRDPALPLDHTTVDDMKRLQSLLEQCAISAAAIPDTLISEPTIMSLRDDQRYAVTECLAERAAIPLQAAKRVEWIDRLTRIVERFTKFYAVLNVWEKLRKVGKEIAWWNDHYASEKLRWSFGMTESPTPHLVLRTESWEEQLSGWRRSQSVAREVPLGSRVVGWDVEFLNPIGLWYSYGCLLFRQEVSFRIRTSYGFRSLGVPETGKWKFTLYYAADEFLDVLVRVYNQEVG